jgi:hypothetical protein
MMSAFSTAVDPTTGRHFKHDGLQLWPRAVS